MNLKSEKKIPSTSFGVFVHNSTPDIGNVRVDLHNTLRPLVIMREDRFYRLGAFKRNFTTSICNIMISFVP